MLRVYVLMMMIGGLVTSGCDIRESARIDNDSSQAGATTESEALHSFKWESPLTVELLGTDHKWQATYRLRSDQSDAIRMKVGRELHVPANVDVVFLLHSTDYIYTLAIPDFRLKEIAVPQLEFTLKFRADAPGRHFLDGEELCGEPGTSGRGYIVVESDDEFEQWLSSQLSLQ